MLPRDGFYAFDPEDMLRDDPLCLIPDCAPRERHTQITRALMQGGKSARELLELPPTRPYPPEPWRGTGSRTLEPYQVRAIRARYKAGGVSTYALADEYDVSQSTIWALIAGLSYRDVA